MVKKFSIVRDTQRGSQSYMEKREGSRERELTRRTREGLKRGTINLGSNQLFTRTIAWKIPWTEEPGRVQSMGLQRVGHN